MERGFDSQPQASVSGRATHSAVGCRHTQPQDLAPAVPKNQQTIKQPKGKRRNDKEIHCGNAAGVVTPKQRSLGFV